MRALWAALIVFVANGALAEDAIGYRRFNVVAERGVLNHIECLIHEASENNKKSPAFHNLINGNMPPVCWNVAKISELCIRGNKEAALIGYIFANIVSVEGAVVPDWKIMPEYQGAFRREGAGGIYPWFRLCGWRFPNIVDFQMNSKWIVGIIYIAECDVVSDEPCPVRDHKGLCGAVGLRGGSVCHLSGIHTSRLHFSQLPGENPRGINSGKDRAKRDNGGKTQYYYIYLFSLGAVTLIGLALTSIGVYGICYGRCERLSFYIFFFVIGGFALLSGLPSILGTIVVYGPKY